MLNSCCLLKIDIMYEVPSNPKIAKVIVTKECITEGKAPEVVLRKPKRPAAQPAGELA